MSVWNVLEIGRLRGIFKNGRVNANGHTFYAKLFIFQLIEYEYTP
jgi:hypothetical protein